MSKACYLGVKGSITESLVLKTIKWYAENKVAYFKKAYAPSLFNSAEPVYTEYGDIDFYGVYRGKYISFEVKETGKDFFYISKIQKHQLGAMKEIHSHGGLVFLIVNFHEFDNNVWMVGFEMLQQLIESNIKRIDTKNIRDFGLNLQITFPGIIDWVSGLANL